MLDNEKKYLQEILTNLRKMKRFELCMMAKKETDVNRNVMHRFLNVMRWQQTVFLSLCVVKLLHWAVLLFYVIVSGYDKVWRVRSWM